ncbi:hypothetical protein FRC07_004601 [Ceratobasidium sp. 392]|nr:hypothetical protein FRC07_004601 [Ceratobasidium sp. 392]
MFIPRSLAKRAPGTSNTSTRLGTSTSAPTLASSESQSGPSNPKKRNAEVDANKSADDPDFEDKSGESSEFGSESSSNSDSDSSSDSGDDGSEKPPTSVLTKSPKTGKDSGTAATQQERIKSEIAARLELALSDLSLWRTESLFRRLSETQDWYIPFSRLHDHPLLAPYFGEYSSRVPDAALINALRTHGSGAFESQIKIRAPSNAAWKGKTTSAWVGAGGGYEVRCKMWERREEGWMDKLADMEEGEWEGRIVYVEHVPSTVRSVWILYHYTTTLARPYQQVADSQIVQNIFVPTAEPNLAERPLETTQRFRGQAFVVFSSAEIAQAFAKRWAWNPSEASRDAAHSSGQNTGKWSTEDAEAAAISSGFRSITKTRWDELKSEYLAHQSRVLKQNSRSERGPPVHNGQQPPSSTTPATRSLPSVAPLPVTHPKSSQAVRPPPFPPGILVFVRRLHPETNKTTLKALFGRAFPNGEGDVIEYLDFQKGIDSAHIRFRTPSDASTFVTHFTSRPLTQHDALDFEGNPCKKEVAMEAEVVGGVREINYWEKVPEKVRMAAVSRAGLGGGEDGSGDRGRRKRQRRG